MKKLHFKYLLFLLLLNCNNEKEEIFETYVSIGETKLDSFTFCSILPKKVEYNYRIGNWKFMSSKGYKIAEGKYDTKIEIIDNNGGCSYKFKKNILNLNEWNFYNENGELIEPNKKILNFIIPKQISTENPFK